MRFRSLNPFENPELTRQVWLELQGKCPPGFFNAWEWVSTWLACLPKETPLWLVVGYVADQPVLAFFVGQHRRRRHGILPTRTLNLNATGSEYFDTLTIEYNSILVDPAHPVAWHALLQHLGALAWDEFGLPGCTHELHEQLTGTDLRQSNLYLTYDRIANSHFVELQTIRDSGMDYLKLLSSNKRSQIRRSLKQYEQDGPVLVREAETISEALSMLEELARLHQVTWVARGETGSFSNEFFMQFHRSLIEICFPQKKVQLLHIYNNKHTLGYLYNFIDDGQVLFYQSGLQYGQGNNYRPGLVAHYLAILHNARLGMRRYDFLAGDTDYKMSLSTNSNPMYWVRLIKGRPRYLFETGFQKLKKIRAAQALQNAE